MAMRMYGEEIGGDVFLKLEKNNDGGVALVAVEPITGKKKGLGCILSILKDGTIYRYPNCIVPGIQTDKDRRVIIAN